MEFALITSKSVVKYGAEADCLVLFLLSIEPNSLPLPPTKVAVQSITKDNRENDSEPQKKSNSEDSSIFMEEEEDDDNDIEGDIDLDQDLPGMRQWEESVIANHEEEPLEDVDLNQKIDSEDDGGAEYPFILSEPQAHAVAKLRCLLRQSSPPSEETLDDAYEDLILQVFVTHPAESSTAYLHTPVEAYLISKGIDIHLAFQTSQQMSGGFSRVQYLALFTLLHHCLKSNDPVKFVRSH